MYYTMNNFKQVENQTINNLIKVTTTKTKTLVDSSKYKGLSKCLPHKMANVYLHGELQDKAGFDIPVFLDGEMDKLGIYENIEFLLPNETIRCTMFLWEVDEFKNMSPTLKGLIIETSDKDGYEDAKMKYNQKRIRL